MSTHEQVEVPQMGSVEDVAAFGPMLLCAAFALAFDQASKELVLSSPHQRPGMVAGAMPCIRVRLNRSAVIALLRRRHALVLWVVAVVGTTLLACYAPALQTLGSRAGLGFALGGATGNLIDVVRRGAIVDFIDLRVFPLFNIADACIVLGGGAALCSIH